ncbi:hypothetical protein NU688_16745 [Variovorax sp. ZS18.2.2]|uniref:hypothetical protein n=1 Tax=Variovorax sp. ZS18.2.2 TaxID=2971255 RepID=UPI002150C288|nr:hypothetical protein [Variovorax sp. ZS18.2.2]MCR6477812.1 hypothetical protein [Variovorax sp. ZS18.2.2]
MHKFIFTLLFLAINTSFAAERMPKEVNLEKLYQRYVKEGYLMMDFPEFDKRISISGVAIELSQGFKRGPDSAKGGALLKAGVAGSNNVLARLVARDAVNAEKMEALSGGAAFKATCTVAFSSGANYIPLQDCVFH